MNNRKIQIELMRRWHELAFSLGWQNGPTIMDILNDMNDIRNIVIGLEPTNE